MIEDKVVVITGGGGLLGREIARQVFANGGIPVITDRDVAAAQEVATKLDPAARRAMAVEMNITSSRSIDECISRVQERYTRIDAVINNAYPRNRNYGRRFEDVEFDDFCENISSHIGGYFLVMQKFAAVFKQQGSGNIVNMASVYGVMAPRFDIYVGTAIQMPVEYAAIKAAIIQLTKYLAKYLQGSGVRVNSLSPGGILDGQPDSFVARYSAHCATKGMLAPSDVAKALLFLLSEESATVNGHNLIIDDGFSL